jgi:4-hydroxybenzoate polyprenyltransferase
MLILILIVIATYQISVAGLLLVFYLSTLLYHHRRFRLKRIFPLSYLIEGVCAAAMVSVGTLSTVNKPECWIVGLGAAAGFLGFALGSPFKDYKDIDGDQEASNQTLYTLAFARKWDIRIVHIIITLVLTMLAIIPISWLYWHGASSGPYLLLGTLVCLSIPVALLAIQNRKKATRTTLWLINACLLIYTLAGWRLGL